MVLVRCSQPPAQATCRLSGTSLPPRQPSRSTATPFPLGRWMVVSPTRRVALPPMHRAALTPSSASCGILPLPW
jgi:hypothetical protein